MREAVSSLESHAALHLFHGLSEEQRRLTTGVLRLGEMVLRPYVLKYRHRGEATEEESEDYASSEDYGPRHFAIFRQET